MLKKESLSTFLIAILWEMNSQNKKKLNIQEGAYLTIGWIQYDVPFFWFESLTYFMIFPSMAMNKSSVLVSISINELPQLFKADDLSLDPRQSEWIFLYFFSCLKLAVFSSPTFVNFGMVHKAKYVGLFFWVLPCQCVLLVVKRRSCLIQGFPQCYQPFITNNAGSKQTNKQRKTKKKQGFKRARKTARFFWLMIRLLYGCY